MAKRQKSKNVKRTRHGGTTNSTKKSPRKVRDRTPIEAVKHKDVRLNIPTEELRGFVKYGENQPGTLLYPRDPSLDPQLVWKGKDQQDAQPLEVPVVPIYIQEKIHPQAIIEDIRRQALREKPADQADLFSDFNGVSFEEMVDFYHHEQHWSNRMILGDSLLVMSSLAEKERLRGKVQMIYIDPPYGIRFGSNWQVSTRKREVRDGRAEDVTRQPEQVKAFRDTWQLGIHSYLSYLRDRVGVARELLTESGSLFVQIGDENVHLVRSILDETFGSEDFVAEIAYLTTTGRGSSTLDKVYDTLLWYGKGHRDNNLKYRPLFRGAIQDEGETKFGYEEEGKRFTLRDSSSQGETESGRYSFEFQGKIFVPPTGRHWSTTVSGMNRLSKAEYLYDFGRQLRVKRFEDDFPVSPINNLWTDTQRGSFQESKIFVVQTNTDVVQRCVLMTTDPGDLVLDPTCGSGTTAFVAEQWGRRWITIDTSRVALALARTRLMSARYPYYLLVDSPEGLKREAEGSGVWTSSEPKTQGDVRKGFVYERVPHVTLKSIASDEEIDRIHASWTEKMDPIRQKLNKLLKMSLEDWEVAPQAESGWSEEAKQLHAEWCELRRSRQKQVDDSIEHHAETELLYDKPYEDNRRIRVAGPFTVESLSPHHVLSADVDRPTSQDNALQESAGRFELMIIENLRAAGVQNTFKKERLKFERLQAYAGTWLQAAGEYREGDEMRRVAVCIGPEHGTVGPELVKEAAKEAVQGVGFDLLIVCGFAFDPHVSEEGKLYGKLQILMARMNPDLAMGQELLKKTGAGNLFMVFGEPDMDVKEKDGKLVVTIKGLDVYDPTTGEVRSSSTDDIACWFIDTDYNGESFFVRHAYFTGAGDPYEKLKRALKAEINEAAWSALYSTKSRPFDPPTSGKIAVKVINHYGDEVLKVYDLSKVAKT